MVSVEKLVVMIILDTKYGFSFFWKKKCGVQEKEYFSMFNQLSIGLFYWSQNPKSVDFD